jgi:hypothetical protein
MPNYVRLTDAVAVRVAELLDARAFAVATTDAAVIVKARQGRSAGSTLNLNTDLSLFVVFKLPLPLPIRLRLRLYFENTADALQQFVSGLSRTDWPAPGATPHARSTDEHVRVWYGSSDEGSAALRWRPFDRRELGL